MIAIPGADEAIVGTYDNDFGVTVPVYSLQTIRKLFARVNRTEEQAADWVMHVIDKWDDEIKPIFINHDPKMGQRILGRADRPN